MKYVAITFIMIFCTAMGRYLSQKLSQRIRILESLISMLNSMKTQLEYTNIPLNLLLNNLRECENFKKLNFIDVCLEKCNNGVEFPISWKQSINESLSLRPLNKQDMDILYNLGNVLGTTDLNGQINICNFYITQFNDRYLDAKEKFKSYGKLCSALGVLSGATIAIILI